MLECETNQTIPLSCHKIDNPPLLDFARNSLPNEGILLQDPDTQYCYLKIHDDFIFKLFPMLKEKNMIMPPYFTAPKDSGAHISVIYEEELLDMKHPINGTNNDTALKSIHPLSEINHRYFFEIKELISLTAFNKTFIALVVDAPELKNLRLQYGLQPKLNYHGLWVPFHITIAINN